MKRTLTSLLCAAIFFGPMEFPQPRPARGQAQLVMLCLVGAAALGVGGVLIWVYSKQLDQPDVRWVVFQAGQPGVGWQTIATNKCVIGPQSEFKAFPALYLYSTNHQCWIKARLAESWEIPGQNRVQSGDWGTTIVYTKEQFAAALTP